MDTSALSNSAMEGVLTSDSGEAQFDAVPPAPKAQAHGSPEPEADEPAQEDAEAPKPAPKAAPKAAAPVAPKKVKVGEEEFDEDTILKAVKGPMEMVRGAQAKFRELADLQKKIEAARAEAEQDPFEAARKRGINPVELAQKILEEEIRKAEMTPEARRSMELEQRLAKMEQAGQQDAQKRQQEEMQQFYQAEIARLDRELPGAMERANLPKSPVSLRLITNILADMHESGVPENLDVAAELAAEQYSADFGHHLKALSYEQAVKRYPDLVKKIREGDLSASRRAPQQSGKPQSPARTQDGKFQKQSNNDLMASEWGPLGVTFGSR